MTAQREQRELLAEIRDRIQVDTDDFEWWVEQKGWGLRPLDNGAYGITLEQAQLLYVMEDPVLWCRAYLNDPDRSTPQDPIPYEFFDFQKPSIRAWQQNAVHQDGAEVGKTREIVALVLWGMCTSFGMTIRNPSMLIAAPQQTHLDEIIMAMEEHLGVEEDARGRKPVIQRHWLKPKKTPHYLARFRTPMGAGRVYFRPAGHDGEAFRGVHVNAGGLFDEAAKAKNRVIWSEFFRALKPGCPWRTYSVPDGDRDTEFYRLCEQAVPELPADQPGVRLFHWPKTLMPAPFWSENRRREFIEVYGGEQSPGYQRNVLGLHGQQENSQFPWSVLEPNVQDVPDYRVLRLTEDANNAELHVEAYRIDLRQQVLEGRERKQPRRTILADRHEALDAWRSRNRDLIRETVMRQLKEFFHALQGQFKCWIGADLGQKNDPTEIMLHMDLGEVIERRVRIQARGVSYDVQCELIYCLDRIFGFQAGLAVDLGSAGAAVANMLQNLEDYEDAHYDERLIAFNFAQSVDAVDEDGEVLVETDKNGDEKPIRMPAKVLATQLLSHRLQRCGFRWPYDQDVLDHYVNHTAKEGARWPIFSKKNDHTIDADRQAMLRKAFDEGYGGSVFDAGVSEREAI